MSQAAEWRTRFQKALSAENLATFGKDPMA
jgi:hypothetical protein